jgi:hypothetical protein
MLVNDANGSRRPASNPRPGRQLPEPPARKNYRPAPRRVRPTADWHSAANRSDPHRCRRGLVLGLQRAGGALPLSNDERSGVNRPFVHYRLSSQFDRDNCLNVPYRDNPIQGGHFDLAAHPLSRGAIFLKAPLRCWRWATPRGTAACGQPCRSCCVSSFKSWGACPNTGMSTMTSKVMIGLASAAIFSVAPTMSASAQRITAQIPKRTCEMVTVDTQNWGKQTIQVCGRLGGPRGQAPGLLRGRVSPQKQQPR